MLPVSTKHIMRYTPEHLKERDDVPVFLLKTPSLRDKIALDACLAIEGVRYPQNVELAAALREGIIEHVVDSDHKPLMEIIEEYEAASEEGNPISTDLNARIEEICKAIRPYHRPLGRIESERGRFLALAMLIRAEMFLIGIEGEGAPAIEKRSGRLTDDCQEEIETKYGAGVLFGIGAQTVNLTTPTEDERKNSESPEPSLPDPEISTEELPHRTARRGKSLVSNTSETHA